MSRRLIVLVTAAAVAAIAFAVVGFLIGDDIAIWKLQRYVDRIYIENPKQPFGIRLTSALLFAWPLLATAVACGVHRWRRGEDPSARAAVAYFVIPIGLIGGFNILQWQFFPMPGGVEPMLSITTFAPGRIDAQLSLLVAIVLWLYVGVRGRDRRR